MHHLTGRVVPQSIGCALIVKILRAAPCPQPQRFRNFSAKPIHGREGQRFWKPEFCALAQENLLRHLSIAISEQHELDQALPRPVHSLELGSYLGLIVEIERAWNFAEKFGFPRVRGGGVLQRRYSRRELECLRLLSVLVPAVPSPKPALERNLRSFVAFPASVRQFRLDGVPVHEASLAARCEAVVARERAKEIILHPYKNAVNGLAFPLSPRVFVGVLDRAEPRFRQSPHSLRDFVNLRDLFWKWQRESLLLNRRWLKDRRASRFERELLLAFSRRVLFDCGAQRLRRHGGGKILGQKRVIEFVARSAVCGDGPLVASARSVHPFEQMIETEAHSARVFPFDMTDLRRRQPERRANFPGRGQALSHGGPRPSAKRLTGRNFAPCRSKAGDPRRVRATCLGVRYGWLLRTCPRRAWRRRTRRRGYDR